MTKKRRVFLCLSRSPFPSRWMLRPSTILPPLTCCATTRRGTGLWCSRPFCWCLPVSACRRWARKTAQPCSRCCWPWWRWACRPSISGRSSTPCASKSKRWACPAPSTGCCWTTKDCRSGWPASRTSLRRAASMRGTICIWPTAPPTPFTSMSGRIRPIC